MLEILRALSASVLFVYIGTTKKEFERLCERFCHVLPPKDVTN